jgi:hypothetical protein
MHLTRVKCHEAQNISSFFELLIPGRAPKPWGALQGRNKGGLFTGLSKGAISPQAIKDSV